MSNKAHERYYAEHAAKLLGEEWRLQDIHEPLDFIVNGSIGLEITMFHQDSLRKASAMREAESNRYRWLMRVSDHYYKLGQPLLVKVLLKRPAALPDPRLFAEFLADAVKPPVGKQERHKFSEEIVFYITALPASFPGYNHWKFVTNHTGCRGTATPQQIQKVLSTKTEKLPSYLKKAAEVDLLIVADSTSHSGMIDYPGPCPNGHGFRRVLFMSYPTTIRILTSVTESP